MFPRASAAFATIAGLLFAAAPVDAQSAGQLNPKIVLQTLPFGGVEVAAWTPDDRYIITAGDASRLVLIWNAATGHIVDRIPLPGGSSRTSTVSKQLLGMTISKDGKELAIRSREVDAKKQRFEGSVKAGIPIITYRMDLASRTFRMTKVGGGLSRLSPDADPATLAEAQEKWAEGDWVKFEEARQTREALVAQTEAGKAAPISLNPLPKSNDGKRALVRDLDGLLIKQEGQPDIALKLARSLRFRDAALSAAGTTLAMLPEPELGSEHRKRASSVELFNTSTGQFLNRISLPGDYFRLQWVDSGRLLATATTEVAGLDEGSTAASAPIAKAALINADTGEVLGWIKPACFMKASLNGGYFGAGLANCDAKAKRDFGLKRYDAGKRKWLDFGTLLLEKHMRIIDLSVSFTGKTLAAVTKSADGITRFNLLDARTGALLKQRQFEGEGSVTKTLLLGDDYLLVSSDGGTATWVISEDEWLPMPARSSSTRVLETDGSVVAVAGEGDDLIGLIDVSGKEQPDPIEFGRVIAGGFLPEAPIFWALSAHDGLRLWDTSKPEWPVLLTTHFFSDQGFVTAMPDGRYDTNLGPDSDLFRWMVPDKPFESLSPQTFMRDYYTPGLTQAVMTCSYFRDCDTTIPPPKPIAELNRVLPLVKILNVEPTGAPNIATVTVAVAEDRDALGRSSGVYDLRLFRDFRFAAHTPSDQDLKPQDALEDWRQSNRLVDDDANPGDGIYQKSFTVFLPTAADMNKPVFTAYAFNEDRVKSETAYYLDYVRPDMVPRKPRAYVVSIGVDAYDEARLKLDYAAADARLMHNRLAEIPGYEMRRLVVAADGSNGAKPTADAINMIMAMLAGFEREEGLKILAEFGIDGSVLEQSSPDDLVIISFSGHGWADPQRNFYMLPSDAVWPELPEGDAGLNGPAPSSLVNMDEMTMWLRILDAADIVLIIDACHAGASVETPNFKAGPLGDRGLGQLAYDKGIKILVATQAEDVALEDSKLRHGLLTYALAGPGEGLVYADGLVDGNQDGRISLDEWINYPIYRLPTLNEDRRVTGAAEAESSSFRFPGRVEQPFKKVQQPTLFDYGSPSKVILRGKRK
jgi:WD40 repeat protein